MEPEKAKAMLAKAGVKAKVLVTEVLVPDASYEWETVDWDRRVTVLMGVPWNPIAMRWVISPAGVDLMGEDGCRRLLGWLARKMGQPDSVAISDAGEGWRFTWGDEDGGAGLRTVPRSRWRQRERR